MGQPPLATLRGLRSKEEEVAMATKRGPKPRPLEKKRGVRVSVYFTTDELAELDARRGGACRGRFLRSAGLGRRLAAAIPELNRQAWAEMARIAGNLNQVTRALNTGGQVHDADLVGILAELHGQVQTLRSDLVGSGHQVEDQVEEAEA
jgi:hypothetical protein